MVTARAQASDRRAGQEAGVDAYLTKPFDPVELVATVLRLLPSDIRPKQG
jgi:DNA-binding response OmpR family regulator